MRVRPHLDNVAFVRHLYTTYFEIDLWLSRIMAHRSTEIPYKTKQLGFFNYQETKVNRTRTIQDVLHSST